MKLPIKRETDPSVGGWVAWVLGLLLYALLLVAVGGK